MVNQVRKGLTGQFLGETGMKTGPKTTLFHGCPDAVVQLIAKNGFDWELASRRASRDLFLIGLSELNQSKL